MRHSNSSVAVRNRTIMWLHSVDSDMRRISLALLVLALGGWLGAIVSQVMAMRMEDEDEKSEWTVTRNQCLLLSSMSMNTLVLSTVYRYVRKIRRGSDQY